MSPQKKYDLSKPRQFWNNSNCPLNSVQIACGLKFRERKQLGCTFAYVFCKHPDAGPIFEVIANIVSAMTG